MVLPNGTNQGDNLEPQNTENLTSLEKIKDLTAITSPEKAEIPADAQVSFATESDPPVKGNAKPRPMTTAEAMAIRSKSTNPNVEDNTPASDPTTVQVGGLFANMSSASVPNSSVVSPINTNINFDEYKQYLSKNNFYFDDDSNLDYARALNQGNIAQLRNGIGSTLVNIIPEAVKQIANALDFEDYANTDMEVGNAVADLMTEWQESVKGSMPIFRENPSESLDVGDFAYWASTGRDLVTSIGGFVLAGYATGAIASGAVGALGLSSKVVAGLTQSKRLQGLVGAAEAYGAADKAKTVLTAVMLNHAEGVGIGAEVFKTVHDEQYNKAIAEGKSDEEAKEIANTKAAEAASGAINFNRMNVFLNLTSANLFVKGGGAAAGLVKKGGWKGLLAEGGQEALEESINDLGQMYGEGLVNGKPLTFKKAIEHYKTKEGWESPILGFIGGAGQTALTKAGKYIQKDTNEAYVRHFNDYIMRNPITPSNKQETIEKATAYAQQQAGTANFQTSAREQIDSLYIEQQSNLAEYEAASRANNMNDVVNATLSAQFSVDLMNQIETDGTLSQEQKDNLLERSLLSHQAYKALNTGTLNQLENLYKSYAEMTDAEADARGFDMTIDPESPEYYKNKAKRALTTLGVYKMNYGASLAYINSTEVYDILNNHYFNTKDLKEKSKANNDHLSAIMDETLARYEADGSEEALKKVAAITADANDLSNIHPDLLNGKMYEDARDYMAAAKVAKEKYELNKEKLDTVTSNAYQKDLAESIKLHRNAKIEKEKGEKTTSSLADRAKALVAKQKAAKSRQNMGNTNNPPNTGNAPVTPPTPPTPPAPPSTQTPPPAPPAPPAPRANTFTGTINVDGITIETPIIQQYVDSVVESMNSKLASTTLSNDEKIKALSEQRDYILYTEMNALGSYYPDGPSVLTALAAKLTDAVGTLSSPKPVLSPEEIEANEAYDSLVTDFALEVEDAVDDANENSKTDQEKDNSLQAVIDNKYEIYSAILSTMGQRGVNTDNFAEVMQEFQNVLGARLVKSQFNTLKGLYNFSKNSAATETYDDLFKSDIANEKELDTATKLAKVFLPSEVYSFDLDKETRMAFQVTHQTVIANNPELATDAYGNPIYNNIGSNLLAYLAQNYIRVAQVRTTEDGRVYTFMDKVTVDSLINENLDPRVLEEDFFKEGAKISFLPLDSFVNDAGERVEAKDLPVGEKPVGIVMNGELIKGLYLHNTSWINGENINNTPDAIENDRARLLALRERILAGEIVETTISSVSLGAPISNPTNVKTTFAAEFAEFPVGVVRSSQVETADGVFDIPSFLSFDDGDVVTVVNGFYFYGSRTNLYKPMISSITASIKAYVLGQHNEGTTILQKQYNTDVLNAEALRNYLRKFVNLSTISINNQPAKDLQTFTEALNALPETQVVLNIIDGKIYIGYGQGIDVYELDPSVYKGQEFALDTLLDKMSNMLASAYANVALNSTQKNDALPIIHEKGVSKVFNTYAEYIQQVSVSPFGSVVLPSGNKITSIQKRVNYDLDALDGKTTNVPQLTRTKAKNPRKRNPKKVTNNVGEQATLTFESFDLEGIIDPDTSFDNVEDLSPDEVDEVDAKQEEVQYTLKSVNILSSPKAVQVFEKGAKNGWDLNKILTELQVPKEQKQLIINKGITSREDIITSLLADNSFVVEVKTATEIDDNNPEYYLSVADQIDLIQEEYDRGNITETEYQNSIKDIKEEKTPVNNTAHYSNLTVPGGTNYKEKEISTPAITPNIKGHAEFSTDNGIGWVRTDEEFISDESYPKTFKDSYGGTYTKEQGIWYYLDSDGTNHKRDDLDDTDIYAVYDNSYGVKDYTQKRKETKTLRVLELQSDLFQKGRGNANLVEFNSVKEKVITEVNADLLKTFKKQYLDKEITKEQYDEYVSKLDTISPKRKDNQFLQLLNTNNNWINFFVKSIIQDSAKQGYEKVLFPSGNTASKVEGHTTLEQFKKIKEDRIKALEKGYKETVQKLKDFYLEDVRYIKKDNKFFKQNAPYVKSIEIQETEFNKVIDTKLKETKENNEVEINQLKKEIADVDGPNGFGALKPIYNFYENTLTNILVKTYGKDNVNLITDDYGNTWNEVTLEKVSKDVNLAPDEVEDISLDAPSRIEGLSTEVQDIIITSIVNDYYKVLKISKTDNLPVERIKVFIQSKIAHFNDTLVAAKIANDNPNNPYNGYDKLLTQVNAYKNNLGKIEELVKRELTREMGIVYSEDNSVVNIKPTSDTNDEGGNLENELPIEDITERSPIYDMNEFAIDPKLSITNEIKSLLKSIVDATQKIVTTQKDVEEGGVMVKKNVQEIKIIDRKIALQLPVYVNPDVVYGDLLRLFTKSSNNAGLEVLNFAPKANSALHPKVQYAIAILEKNYNTKPYFANVVAQLEQMDEQTQIQFLTTFNKNFTEHIFTLERLNEEGETYDLRIVKNASQDAKNLLLQKWQNQLKNTDSFTTAVDDRSTGIYLSDRLVESFNTVFNKIKGDTDLQTYPNFRILFQHLGIELSEAAFVGLRNGAFVNGRAKTIEQQFEHKRDGWLHLMHKQVNYIHSAKIDMSLLFEDSSFKEFADFMSKYDTTQFNTSHRNANGDTIYGVTNNRYFMERFIGLKSNQILLKNLHNNPFSSSSEWLSNLYNKSTGTVNNSSFAQVFEYNTADGLKTSNDNKSKTVDKLGRKEMIQLGLSMFFNNGMTISGGQTPVHKFIIPALSDKSNMFTVQAPGAVYNIMNNGRLAPAQAQDLRKQLVEPEVLRILNQQEKGDKGIRGYDGGATKFLMLPALNNIPELWENGKLKSDALIEHADLIDEVVMRYIMTETTNLYKEWNKLGLLKEGKAGVFSDKMVYADKNYLEAVKKAGTSNMEQAYAVVFNYTINYMVANANMQMLIFNDPAFFYKGNSKVDGVDISGSFINNTWDNITKRYAAINGGKDEFQFPTGSSFNVLVLKDAEVVSTQLDYLKKVWKGHPDYESIINAYSNLNSADAQEWTSLEEHLDRMFYSGSINRETKDRVLANYKKTGSVSKEDLGKVLIPFKPLYFNTYKDASGVMRTLYIKSSSFPLIKELTAGTELDAVREYLDDPKNKVSVVTFESAVKAGANTNVLPLFNSDGSIIPDALKGEGVESSIIRNIPREGHGNQQSNPDKSLKNYINDGTQQAKLIFTNLLGLNGFKNPFTGKSVTGKELANEYLNKYDERFAYLHKQFVNKFDIRGGVVHNMKALRKELVKEGLTRNWTFNEIDSFALNDIATGFDIPLWQTISSAKIESLLSSLIDNSIRKRKRVGRAYILGANTGIRTFNANVDTAEKGIIFLDSFKGDLHNSYNSSDVMTDAEILVPFRFYDNAGNLLKITDFIVDGKVDHTKLPLEVLQGFGYRIPTSGVNLMSNIKIVGFLPESYGDMIMAPADFTAQMGSDFDVDKFYSSLVSTFYDEATGSLEKITRKHLDSQREQYNVIKKAKNKLRNLKNYKGVNKATQESFNEGLIKNANNNPLIANAKGNGMLKDLEVLVLDNEITDIQRAVLSNHIQAVQRARTKPLSFGRLPEMVEKLASKTRKPYRTILNRSYQDEAYLNGKAGKVAVGNFSLDMILNSVGQYIEGKVNFQHKIKNADGTTGYTESFTTLFGMASNRINDPMLNDKSGRFKSDVLEGLMAAALDNGKEQILGKLGIEDNTFDYIRGMVAMGFNEEVIMLILNQPLLKYYLDANTNPLHKMAIDNAINGIDNRFNIFAETDEKLLYEDLNLVIDPGTIQETMKKAVDKGVVVKKEYLNSLIAIHTFKVMERRGQQLSMVRSALNGDSAGVGKNIIYSKGKEEQVGEARNTRGIKNVEGYFTRPEQRVDTESGEVSTVNKSNSLGHMAYKRAIALNAELWDDYFPFGNDVMTSIIKLIGENTGKEIFRLNSYSDYATIVLKDFKSFLNAKAFNALVPNFLQGKSRSDLLKSILYSNNTHQSLGEFILDLKEGANGQTKYSNILINSLTINRPPTLTATAVISNIVDIKYTPVNQLSTNENGMVNSLIDMINTATNKEVGIWNGNVVTTRDLANLLITHQLITKGVPSNTKFIQFIPTQYLKMMGYYDNLAQTYREFLATAIEEEKEVNPVIPFRVQHIQHNMADYYNRKADKAYKDRIVDGKLIFREEDLIQPHYVIFKTKTGYVGYIKLSNTKGYAKLTPLGWGDNTEYNHEIINPVSINPKNNSDIHGRVEYSAEDTYKGIENESVLLNLVIDSKLGKKQELEVNGVVVDAYPVTLLKDGYKDAYYLVKNGKSYNTIYHPLTGLSFTVGDMKVSATKEERDNALNRALDTMTPEFANALGLADAVESINIEAIEADLPSFLYVDRDKSDDVFPDEINAEQLSFVEELGLDDNSMNLVDKYELIFSAITSVSNKSNPILAYFLSHAKEILPVISNIPIVLNPNLKSKGKFVSDSNNNGYISINPTKFKTVEEMAATVAEEAIHALFKRQVRVNNKIVKDIESLRREAQAKLIEIHGQEAFDTMKSKVEAGTALIKGVESRLLYSVLNVDEFIAAVLTKPEFQEFLNNNEIFIAKKSMWTKLIELMGGILRLFGVNVDSRLEDSLAHIIALTNDIKKNHMTNLPSSKYDRSLNYINEKYNLMTDSNTLLPKGNAQQIASHIENTFANVTAKVVDNDYVEIMPLQWSTGGDIQTDLSVSEWDVEFLPIDYVEPEIRANYYTYALSLRARIREGEKALRIAKIDNDNIKAELITANLENDRVSLATLPKLTSLADFQLRAKEELETVDNILKRPMSSEDIIYVRNSLNFWTDVIEYTFTAKHKESKQLMNDFNLIQNQAKSSTAKLENIEKLYLENFVKSMTGRTLSLTDIFSEYEDIGMVTAYSRDISTYDNALLDSIWKSVQFANMRAEKEADTLMERLNKLLETVLPKLDAMNPGKPYEIFRQLTDSGKKTNHLISPFSDLFYKEKSRVYDRARTTGTSVDGNSYADWVRNNSRVFDLNTYFPIGEELTDEIKQARKELENEIGTTNYNMWIVGQERKLASYEKRKETYLAILRDDYKLASNDEIAGNEEAATRFGLWTRKHSPYEFSKILNTPGYRYYNGTDGLDGFRGYEIIPNKEKHFNKDFDVISGDASLLEFYNEFSDIYEELKKYVPQSQFATLIYGGLPVIEKSIYQAFSTRGLKVGFAAVRDAMVDSLTTNVRKPVVEELDLLTGQNNKSMHVAGITSNSEFIKDYVARESLAYEVKNHTPPSQTTIDGFHEEAVDMAAEKGDFDLGKIMKIFGTLVITHKHIAAIEDTIKIGQYTINSYAETERSPDGTKATRKGGVIAPKTPANSFKNTKASLMYFMDSQIYGNVKDEEGKMRRKLRDSDEQEHKEKYQEMMSTLQDQFDAGEITKEYFDNGMAVIKRNIAALGSQVVASKIGDNWLAYVQLKLMGWNILGGFSNIGFGFISNMIEAAGEEQFTLAEMNSAYRTASASIAKNLSFDTIKLGQASKIRAGMHKMNVLKDASHELYTTNSASRFSGKFKWLSPYNMNQRTEYMNQAPLMIAVAKKTMVMTTKGEVSIWDGMDSEWEWNEAEYGPLAEKDLFELRLNINQTIKRFHGNYDPNSPIMAKKKFLGRAVLQFRTWLIESSALRFEAERYDEASKRVVKGRYVSLWDVFTTKSDNMTTLNKSYEMGKAMANALSFGALKISSFNGGELSKVDAANMRKVAMELVLLLDMYLLIALLKLGLDDEDDENATKIYNAALNQGTRLRSDLLLYVNPNEFKNIMKDPIASLSLMGDIGNLIHSIWDYENDEIKSGVHKGDSRFKSSVLKAFPGSAKAYSIYNSGSQIYDKDLIDKDDK